MTPDLSASRKDSAVSNFWIRYLALLRKHSVPEKHHHWYRQRVEQYLQFYKGRKLATHTTEELIRYLEQQSSSSSLPDWQFRHISEALRILFCDLVKTSWCNEVDWSHWAEGARRLSTSHPTLAREADLKEAGSAPIFENAPKRSLQKKFPDLYQAVVTAIRVRGYAIRTEQTYLQWVERYIRFHDWAPADSLSATDVNAFLEYLAVKRNASASTQNQALCAIVFLYGKVLERNLDALGEFARAK